MFKRLVSLGLLVFTIVFWVNVPVASAASSDYVQNYKENYPAYLKFDKVIADAFLADYNNSEAQALVARAIWYMENGYMVYGHSKYWDTGYIDCSNFVSVVYKDFGYEITSASKNYNQVGEKVEGVYCRKISGSTKYELVGTENLRPGDIFTYWAEDSDGSGTHIGHVALYVGEVNGVPAIIQTNSDRPTAIGIRTDFRYWYGEHFIEARRVLDDASQVPGKKWTASSPVIPAEYQLSPQKSVVMPEAKFMSYNADNNETDTTAPIENNDGATDASDDASGGENSGTIGNTDETGGSSGEETSGSNEQAPTENNNDSTDGTGGGRSSGTTDQVANESNSTDSSSEENSSASNNITNDSTTTGQTDSSSPEAASDIAGHWAEQSFNQLIQAQYISGYPDGTFRPDTTITRAEFVTILVKTFQLDPATGKVFDDTGSHWASAEIATAQAHSIIEGFSDTSFGPDDPVTREQMVVMILKACQIEPLGQVESNTEFEDSSQISDWANDDVFIANQEKLITGYADGTFKPQAETTRAEAVTVIARVVGQQANS